MEKLNSFFKLKKSTNATQLLLKTTAKTKNLRSREKLALLHNTSIAFVKFTITYEKITSLSLISHGGEAALRRRKRGKCKKGKTKWNKEQIKKKTWKQNCLA